MLQFEFSRPFFSTGSRAIAARWAAILLKSKKVRENSKCCTKFWLWKLYFPSSLVYLPRGKSSWMTWISAPQGITGAKCRGMHPCSRRHRPKASSMLSVSSKTFCYYSCARSRKHHIVWKLLKMSHFNFFNFGIFHQFLSPNWPVW